MDRDTAMVSEDWAVLDDELARWREAGRSATFWWRDDDAVQRTPALERLLGLAREFEMPLALAVVPAAAQASLFDALPESVCVLQHGVDHRDRSSAGAKRSEFPFDEPADAALARIAEGGARLARLAGARWSAAFAPPWNRLPAALAARLPAAGLRGLSAFGARACAYPAAGLVQVNTHVDLIAWREDRGFVGVRSALAQAVRHLAARRRGEADPDEPTGWLTHHLQHDAATWDFLARLLASMRRDPAVRWLSAQPLFAAQQT
ncbi:MAG: hypothetical protein LJE90_09735 [Betaproteobacteria bacterium]|nr:hypothetical protein [Betaproteobacteria bacterium]